MLMTFAELRYRANMTADPIWEQRYRAALDHHLPDPVDLDEVNRLMGGNQGFFVNPAAVLPIIQNVEASERPVKSDAETWRDRAIREPLL